MNIYNLLKQDIIAAISKIIPNILSNDTKSVVVEMPKDASNGDLSTNAAMVLSKIAGKSPRELATILVSNLSNIDYITDMEIAGPGFINFRIHPSKWYEEAQEILDSKIKYGSCNIGSGIKVNLEYASPNPTGPMHIGHARGAVYGDSLSRLLQKCGYQVTKEYYINDAGGQVIDLAKTVFLRYKEAYTGKEVEIPAGLYPGDYLKPIGAMLSKEFGDKFLKLTEEEYLPIIKNFAIKEMLKLIKEDLAKLGICHDVFSSEQSLYDDKKVEAAIDELTKLGLVYEGTLPPPKGEQQDDWEERPQLLFKSTEFGDDIDRPLQKSDKSWTYFAGDIGYTADKISRGFNCIILALGADHGGYVKRIKAVIQALGKGAVTSDIKLCQLVNFVENGVPIKMSKRAGSFLTANDVVSEVGKDIVRFMMLSRKNDIVLDFDLAKVREQSKDNPVFYVQYAYVRTKSILAGAKLQIPEAVESLEKKEIDWNLLSSKEELDLIKMLGSFPKMVEGAAVNFEPHRVAFYLQSVASSFHSLWNLGKENNDYRFIIENDAKLTTARLALVSAVAEVINAGFDIIGIDLVEKM
ncbi:MAG: arginine--tRNA ligase [Rickettsiaceae bacterium]|nr:arginine--tRNA ligase [Rickettsiaceae bacterium]